MKNFEFLQNLNSILENYCEKNAKAKVSFCAGNAIEQLVSTLKNIAPYSRVAVLYTEKSAQELMVKNIITLKNAEYRHYDVVIKQQAVLSVDSVLDACVLPEDVRVVVTFDYSLLTALKYVSTVNNIPAILVNLYNETENLLDSSDFIRNKNKVDRFNFNSPLTIIFNDYLDAFSKQDFCIEKASLILDLIDYKLSCSIKGRTINKNAISLLQLEGFNLIEDLLKVQVANFISDDKIHESSAICNIEKAFILANDKKPSITSKIKIIKTLYKMYNFGFSETANNVLEIVDFGGMINSACNSCKLDFSVYSAKFLKFLDDCTRQDNKIQKCILEVLEILKKQAQTFEELDSLSNMPKDRIKKDLVSCVRNGACINPNNGLGLLTEKGIIKSVL